MEPIVFRDVHPLYAVSDIRGSSTHRAWAIQADLLTQLGLAREVLRAAHEVRPLPILDQLTHRIDGHVAEIEVTLRSGDELGVMSFLKGDVEPLFDHLQTFGSSVRERVDAYRHAVDPGIGLVYARRKEFDESVTMINEAVSSYIDMEEQAAQGMFPHYFEKQKTDGVDYTIYLGGALREDNGFDPLYLKNLRLWQLMVACGVALRVERLKTRLPVTLDITNLILIQHAPLSIRFRFDEKRFDVDGAYNVRYEIIKKRIDKAIIRGTTERLTQPGKIALVYSHATEAAEWREYIEYLQRLGYLTRRRGGAGAGRAAGRPGPARPPGHGGPRQPGAGRALERGRPVPRRGRSHPGRVSTGRRGATARGPADRPDPDGRLRDRLAARDGRRRRRPAPSLLPRRSRSLGVVLRGRPDPLRRGDLLPAGQRAVGAVTARLPHQLPITRPPSTLSACPVM